MSIKKLKLDLATVSTVFVYGTLKKGFSNNSLLNGATLLGAAESLTHGQLKSWGPPCFVPEEWLPEGAEVLPVRGELWEIDDPNILARLDSLEGHPHGYYRSLIEVEVQLPEFTDEDGSGFYSLAWCYFYDDDELTNMCPVVDGCYEWMPKEKSNG